jgi:hypothetical protein
MAAIYITPRYEECKIKNIGFDLSYTEIDPEFANNLLRQHRCEKFSYVDFHEFTNMYYIKSPSMRLKMILITKTLKDSHHKQALLMNIGDEMNLMEINAYRFVESVLSEMYKQIFGSSLLSTMHVVYAVYEKKKWYDIKKRALMSSPVQFIINTRDNHIVDNYDIRIGYDHKLRLHVTYFDNDKINTIAILDNEEVMMIIDGHEINRDFVIKNLFAFYRIQEYIPIPLIGIMLSKYFDNVNKFLMLPDTIKVPVEVAKEMNFSHRVHSVTYKNSGGILRAELLPNITAWTQIIQVEPDWLYALGCSDVEIRDIMQRDDLMAKITEHNEIKFSQCIMKTLDDGTGMIINEQTRLFITIKIHPDNTVTIIFDHK